MVVIYSPLIDYPIWFSLYPAHEVSQMLSMTLAEPSSCVWIVPGTEKEDE